MATAKTKRKPKATKAAEPGAKLALHDLKPPRGSVTLDPEAIHLLSNHLAVIVGFVELMLADAAPGDSHFRDLSEIRMAAVAAANLINRWQGAGDSGQ